MNKPQIFQDLSGRRWFFARVGFSTLGAFALLVLASGLIGILIPVDIPAPQLEESSDTPVTLPLSDVPADSGHRPRNEASPSGPAPSRQQALSNLRSIRSAFTVQDDPGSVASLRAHLSQLDLVFPDWFSFSNPEGKIDVSVDGDTFQLLKSAGKLVLPRISNTSAQGEWYVSGLPSLFRSAKATNKFVDQIISSVERVHADGINLDVEGVEAADEQAFVVWFRKIADALHARGLLVTVDVPMGDDSYDLKAISAISDVVVLMAYDEHYPTGAPGSIAGQNWFDDGLADTLKSIPRDKLIVGIGAYGYDWTEGKTPAEPISFYDAASLAERAGATIETDSETINSRFSYRDEEGKNHQVWLLDAVSAWNEVVTVRRTEARGLAVWRLGTEEPTLWSLLRAGAEPAFSRGSLEKIPSLSSVTFRGEGALLRIADSASDGTRDIEFEDDSIVWAKVDALPRGFQVDRPLVRAGKKLALTFDDGPDPTWTPQILSVLAKYGIRATFFVVGNQAERYPQLVRAEFAAGHLLGNHTYLHPQLETISDTRMMWELNATQRLVQALTGHSTVLFRAPYNAHADPVLASELHALRQATQMGYLIAGSDIDSEDYQSPAGDTRADHIVRTVMTGLRNDGVHVIVFHDAGGDRSGTVGALDKLIPDLLAQGYQFVGVDGLLDVDPSKLMPPISEPEQLLAAGRRIILWVRVWGSELLVGLLFVATAMSIARMLFLGLLIARGKSNASARDPAAFLPDVRVLIPAHNEAKVIAQTLEAVLKSEYAKLRVTVIDDGSSDDTGRIVEEFAKADPRLSLITQPDCCGKAAALNRGFNEAHEDYIITIDADTVVFPHTVARLVEPFADPAVDAVCGNVQVGNIRNALTRFQHVE
jgi:peptidoglycan-N-acetylglucosamine deacetylase